MINMIKLTNGDTIVGKIVNETDLHLSIENPLQVRMTYETIYPTLVATYWIPLSVGGEIVDVRQAHIVIVADVHEDVKGYYERTLTRLSEARQNEDVQEIETGEGLHRDSNKTDLETMLEYIRYQASANNSGGNIH